MLQQSCKHKKRPHLAGFRLPLDYVERRKYTSFFRNAKENVIIFSAFLSNPLQIGMNHGEPGGVAGVLARCLSQPVDAAPGQLQGKLLVGYLAVLAAPALAEWLGFGHGQPVVACHLDYLPPGLVVAPCGVALGGGHPCAVLGGEMPVGLVEPPGFDDDEGVFFAPNQGEVFNQVREAEGVQMYIPCLRVEEYHAGAFDVGVDGDDAAVVSSCRHIQAFVCCGNGRRAR